MNGHVRTIRGAASVWAGIILSVVILLAVAPTAQAVIPGATWETASPASQNVDPTRLDAAVVYLESLPAAGKSTELVIVRNGYLIWQGSNVTNRHGVYSVTKSFMSILFGLLVEDQEISLDQRAESVDPNLGSHYANVTMRHFLTMTPGYGAISDDSGNYCYGSKRHAPRSGPAALHAARIAVRLLGFGRQRVGLAHHIERRAVHEIVF
ncbi:MAG: serine hydrolase [Desulfosarcinaceae bacterium]|nr:serine hydrolase [Desulfosarcinaceae bacterium]